MVDDAQITLQVIPWDARAACDLASAMRDDPLYTINDQAGDVQEGRARLIGVYRGAARVGSVTVRLDNDNRDFVIQAAGGFAKGISLARHVIPALVEIGKAVTVNGVRTVRKIRCHPHRQGMVKMLNDSDFRLVEYVLEREV